MPIGGTFVAAGGHLHPGGLWDDLYVDRGGKSAHVFRSNAKYFEPAGPVSWDVALGVTRADWRLHVKAGDTLRLTTTYDSSKRSWYEAMGIMVAWFAPNQTKGIDPFAVKPVNMLVRYTHGHLPENNNHGGQVDPDLADPATLPSGPLVNVHHDQLLQILSGRPLQRDVDPDRAPRAVDSLHEHRRTRVR